MDNGLAWNIHRQSLHSGFLTVDIKFFLQLDLAHHWMECVVYNTYVGEYFSGSGQNYDMGYNEDNWRLRRVYHVFQKDGPKINISFRSTS